MMKQKILNAIPFCCETDFLNISACSVEEQVLLREIMPSAKTVIVLAHHVKTFLEWAWFPLESERNNNTCGADLHSKNVLETIGCALKEDGHTYCCVPYPGRCEIRMKDIASRTALGQIGDNYMFLHSSWGPWTHLRLLLTDAVIASNSGSCADVCIHCGKCASVCPAQAIGADSFNGVACGQYQGSQHNGIKDNYLWKCNKCAQVCPVGTPPSQIKITAV